MIVVLYGAAIKWQFSPMQDIDSYLSLLKRKDATACAQLYDQYAPGLYRTIMSLVKDETTACDVLQKSFATIYEQIDCIDPVKNKPFIWMLQIAVQHCRQTVKPLTPAEIKQSLARKKDQPLPATRQVITSPEL